MFRAPAEGGGGTRNVSFADQPGSPPSLRAQVRLVERSSYLVRATQSNNPPTGGKAAKRVGPIWHSARTKLGPTGPDKRGASALRLAEGRTKRWHSRTCSAVGAALALGRRPALAALGSEPRCLQKVRFCTGRCSCFCYFALLRKSKPRR